MSVTPVMRNRVSRVARSMTASDGHSPPGKMYVWIQLAPRSCRSYAASGKVIDLEAQPAARSQRPIAGLEERGEVLGADRLEHLDRDDGVVRALDVAVVAQLDVDEVLQPGVADALPGQLELLASRS